MWLSVFGIYDLLYYQVHRGTGDGIFWAAEFAGPEWLFSFSGVREWWQQQQFAFSPGFKEYIDANA